MELHLEAVWASRPAPLVDLPFPSDLNDDPSDISTIVDIRNRLAARTQAWLDLLAIYPQYLRSDGLDVQRPTTHPSGCDLNHNQENN